MEGFRVEYRFLILAIAVIMSLIILNWKDYRYDMQEEVQGYNKINLHRAGW